MKLLRLFLTINLCAVLFSCKSLVKPPEPPKPPDTKRPATVTELMDKLRNINRIEGIGAIKIKTPGKIRSGTASLKLYGEDIDIRFYSMGILVGEIKENQGIIKSDTSLTATETDLLIQAVKKGIRWWNIMSYKIEELDNKYVISNTWQSTILKKETYMPLKQTLSLSTGKKIIFYYKNSIFKNGFWYPKEIEATHGDLHLSIFFDEINLGGDTDEI